MERYELTASAVVSGIIPVKKYRSKETGFTVCIADVDGPLVNGYFCLATEAHDDDGLPHTLEHLVFMGSEEYPYKGMLDLFANRCLAQGTNAWTDTDHTCYTMTTAGSEGFLNLLPIYLDHVLYPTLTDSAFLTEVHHINGTGENAGVVYCEMQARENTGYSRTFLEFQRAMYPGHCGYKSETGGIMKNLRESCSNDKVRYYHREFYRPENLCLIITGNVNPEDVFRVVRPFEEKIKTKGERQPYTRPWMNEVPALETVEEEKHILFATEDESSGMVLMGWRGPPALDLYRVTALNILFEYLTDTPVAPLQKELVEIDEPLCGDIDFQFMENKETSFLIHADNVPKENLFEIKSTVLEVLRKIATGQSLLDMDRMKTLLHRSILKEMNGLEDRPHDTLASLAIGDFLFSEKGEHLQDYVNKLNRLKKLEIRTRSFWTDLLKDYVIDKKIVVIIGDPSEEYMKTSGAEEKERISQQIIDLGENGLKAKKGELEKAIEKNSVDPPPALVNQLQIPSTDSIRFYEIQSNSNNVETTTTSVDALKKFPLQDLPCAFYVQHINSLFVQVYVLIDNSSLSETQRMYLPLYTEVLFESPVLRDGVLIPYEDIVKELAGDTIETDAYVGTGCGGRFSAGNFASLMTVSFKVEIEKYEKSVQWVRDVLFNLKFSPDRLKVVANKMISDVANYKRSGRHVASVLLKDITYTKASNHYVCNMVRQHKFLTELLKQLDESPDTVLQNLESFRSVLLKPENFRFYVAANIDKLPSNPEQIWQDMLFQNMSSALDRVTSVEQDLEFIRAENKCKAVGVGSVESAYLLQQSEGVDSYDHPDYPAILVFIEYLCALEGPLWRQIRGCGYSYNYRMGCSPSSGQISFVLAKSTHIFKAYEIAKKITADFVSGETIFEVGQLEAAISGTVFQTIEKEQTVGEAVVQNILSEFKRTSSVYNRKKVLYKTLTSRIRDLLKKLSEVTIHDLKRVGESYFTKLFEPSKVSAALCCHPTKIDEIVADFKKIGLEFDVIKSLEDTFEI